MFRNLVSAWPSLSNLRGFCLRQLRINVLVSIAVTSFSLFAVPVAAQVTVVGNVATGTGNLSGGVTNQGGSPDFTTPPVSDLVINNLTQDIAPASGTPGVEFFGPVTFLGFDTGAFEIVADGAPAVNVENPSTVTYDTANSTIRTTGAAAPLFRTVTVPGGSPPGTSLSFSVENSTFSTAGADSPLLRTDLGSNADYLLFSEDTNWTSTGANSGLVEYTYGSDNNYNSVFLTAVLSTSGTGSAAIRGVGPGGGDINENLFIGGTTTITTQMANSGGVVLGDLGANSTRTVTLRDSSITTNGNASPGLSVGSVGDLSVQEVTLDNTPIDTTGDDSAGITDGGAGTGSAVATNISNASIITRGDRSAGIALDGAEPVNSAENTNFINVDIRTEGADSVGLLARSAPFESSTTVRTFDQIDITTTGERSDGLVLGEQTASDLFSGSADMSSLTINVDQTTISTQDDESRGLVINGFGDGAMNSDAGVLIQNLNVTTQGENAVGVVINSGSEGAADSFFSTAADNITVNTAGNGATGFILNSGTGGVSTGTSRFTTVFDNTSVTTSGDNADGIVLGPGLGEEDGSLPAFPNPTNTLAVGTGVSATTSGANSHALVVSENTVLAMLSAGNPDSRITNLDNFVATGSGSRAVQNNGLLQTGPSGEVFTNGTGVRGNIANSGTIEGSGPNALTYDTAANSDDLFELQPGGVVNGNVLAGNGTDAFVLGGEGTDSFDHTLLGTQYQDFETFTKEDDSTWTLTGADSAAAFLPGTITGGTLVVNPNLSAFDLVVMSQGTLAGSGGVGMLTSAGTFSPGGVGTAATFDVAGDLTFQSGSVFNVDILADGTSDLVAVNGTATLAGTIAINGVMFPSGFPLENEYTILTAPGTLLGTFDSVIDNLPDVDAMVMVLAPTGPTDPDPNQPGRVVVSYMRSADTSDKAILPNSVQFAGQAGLLFGETLQRQARLLDRCYHNGKSFWHTGLGSYTEVDSTGSATGYSGGMGGYAAGADRQFELHDACFRLGMAGAFTGGSAESGISTAGVDANYIGAYASLIKQGWLMSSSLGYGFLDFDMQRGIPVGGGGTPMLASGSADGGVFNYSWAGSYNLAHQLMFADGSDFRFAPIVRFDYTNAYRSGYSESGTALLDLTVQSTRYHTGIFSLGVETGRRARNRLGWDVNTLLDVRWEHLTGNLNAQSESTLTNVGGAPFVDAGVAEVRNRVALGVGVGVDVNHRVSTHMRYDASISNRSTAQRGSGGVTIRY